MFVLLLPEATVPFILVEKECGQLIFLNANKENLLESWTFLFAALNRDMLMLHHF